MPMPLMGTTAPASPIGTCIVSMAEILSTVVLLQSRRSRLRPYRRPRARGADMRTGQYVCGAPEATVASIASLEMCRFYGLPNQLGGLGGDARYPDLQEGSEGALSAALGGARRRRFPGGLPGTLDGAQSFSLADAVLDNDAMAAVRRLLGECAVDPSASLLEDVVRWGPVGIFGWRSTRAMLPAGRLWEPGVFRRGRAQGDPKALVREAAARAAELLQTHEAAAAGR